MRKRTPYSNATELGWQPPIRMRRAQLLHVLLFDSLHHLGVLMELTSKTQLRWRRFDARLLLVLQA